MPVLVKGARSNRPPADGLNHRRDRTGIDGACDILTQSGAADYAGRCRNVHAKAAASKMPILGSSLFHGLRGGGTYRLNAGMCFAMISAMRCFVVAPNSSK